jgi:hypothetical protein
MKPARKTFTLLAMIAVAKNCAVIRADLAVASFGNDAGAKLSALLCKVEVARSCVEARTPH